MQVVARGERQCAWGEVAAQQRVTVRGEIGGTDQLGPHCQSGVQAEDTKDHVHEHHHSIERRQDEGHFLGRTGPFQERARVASADTTVAAGAGALREGREELLVCRRASSRYPYPQNLIR
jgi:hypothetical protein